MAFVYHDRENRIGVNTAKNKDAHKSENQILKRSVLGVINNNSSNNDRLFGKQPKQLLQPKTLKPSTFLFNIHEDKIEAKCPRLIQENKVENVNIKNKNNTSQAIQKKTEKISTFSFNIHHDNIEMKYPPTAQESKVENVIIKNDNKKDINFTFEPIPKVNDESRHPLKDIIASDENKKTPESKPLSSMLMKISEKQKTNVAVAKSSIFCLETYSAEILLYLKELEKEKCAKPNYMRRQQDITYNMRTILVDWLVEVAEEYKMHTQTLFLAVSLVDRFLSTMSVVKAKLQLLGTASMFVAAKCEEIYPPDVSEFVYITDDTYTVKQVLRMEYLILKVLEFEMSRPTTYSFITHFSSLCNLPDNVIHLSMYLCELMLLEGDPYLQYKVSILACSAMAVARYSLGYSDVWPENFIEITGYTIAELESCITYLNVTHEKSSTTQYKAVFNKYAKNKLMNVSSIKASPLDVAEYLLPMKEMGDVTLKSSPIF